jgi:AraC family transcriptional activator of pobA
MSKNAARNLFDPRRGGQPVRTARVSFDRGASEPQRSNYFSVYLIESGSGEFWADAARHRLSSRSLLFFTPYQRIRFTAEQPIAGRLIQFHANFLCVETFHAEVGCSSVLFNDPYGVPLVSLKGPSGSEIKRLVETIFKEDASEQLASRDVILSSLKILLVLATRMKSASAARSPRADQRHPLLAQLRELIEAHYQTQHSPAAYARQLGVSAKTLGRIVREQLGSTPTDLIRSRVLIHAKWQLLHTLRPVKEIAREVGFDDELYFSRLFKKATGFSPKFFREFETEIRGGSNLSMPVGDTSIQPPRAKIDT